MSKKTKFQPIAMVKPSEDFIYAPSRIRSDVETSDSKYVKDIPVSFEDDGVSNPVSTPAYRINNNGLFGWFIKKG